MKMNEAENMLCPFFNNSCKTTKCMLWISTNAVSGYCGLDKASRVFINLDKKKSS